MRCTLQSGSDNLPLYTLPLCIVLLVGLWCSVSILIAIVGGWQELSKRFSSTSGSNAEIEVTEPFFYSVYMRFWGLYSSVIRITPTKNALYLSVFSLFRIGHPPLCIPWREVKLDKTSFLWQRYVVLTLGQQEHIPMRISERLARNLGILDGLPR